MNVAVVGAAGYAGGELLRLLLQHPEVRECVATSRSQAGQPIADAHPALAHAHRRPLLRRHARRGRARARRRLPLPGARRIVPRGRRGVRRGARARRGPRRRLPGPRPRALRAVLRPARGARAAAPLLLRPGRRAGARAPGCRRARRAGLLRHRGASSRSIRWRGRGSTCRPSLFAVTGSSGAGVQPKPTTHHPMRAHNLFAYSVLGHRHEAEVLQSWREWIGRPDATARLMTHSGPFVRGIYLTLHAYLPARPRGQRRRPRDRGAAPGFGRPTRTGRSSGCSTRRPSSPMRWGPTTP